MKDSSGWMVREIFPKLGIVIPGTIHLGLPTWGRFDGWDIGFHRYVSSTTRENRHGLIIRDDFICVSQMISTASLHIDYVIWHSIGMISLNQPGRGYLRQAVKISPS